MKLSSMGDYRGISPMDFSGNLAENWRLWKQKFENYLLATEISRKSDPVKIAQLLHFIGEEGFHIYNSFSIDNPAELKLKDVLDKFEEHFLPRKNLAYERFKFFTRKQATNETIEQYITDLKNKAQSCEFGDLKNDLIKDILTCGILNEKMREKLLQDDELDLDGAIKLCISIENSREQSNLITSNSSKCLEVQTINKSKNKKHMKSFPKPPRSYATNPRPTQQERPTTSSGQRLKGNSGVCYRCGNVHGRNQCPAFGKKCSVCGLLNHFAKVCRSKHVNTIDCTNISNDDYVFVGSINNLNETQKQGNNGSSWYVNLLLNNCKEVKFKIDTGAMINIINVNILNDLYFDFHNLQKTTVQLSSYTNNLLSVIGTCFLNCTYNSKQYNIEFFVVESNSLCILGLETSIKLNLIKRVDSLENTSMCEIQNYGKILEQFSHLFTGLGCLKEKYHIELINNAQPVVHPPRKIPLPLLKEFKNVLRELENSKIIRKVDEPTEWVNPIIIVRKPNGSLRICLDPHDLNLAIKREHFQLPTLDQITTKLANAKYFSKLDANSGFWQISLDDESAKLCTFATPYGRYCFLRLPYGIKSAPEVFHKRYKKIFDLEGVELYIDDIIIWGSTKAEHDKRLLEVFKLAKLHNVTFNKEKCKFGLTEITFMGHKFTKDGYYPDESKIKAIKKMPVPQNKQDVQRFLGMVTYVSRFVPNLSKINSPLRELIKKDVAFHWSDRHMESFQELKQKLVEHPVLQYYDINKPVILSVDSSKDGVGACLLQNNLPVAYASQALTESQKKMGPN